MYAKCNFRIVFLTLVLFLFLIIPVSAVSWSEYGDAWIGVDGAYTVIMWNTTGEHTWLTTGNTSSVEYLVVGGGGGGGKGNGWAGGNGGAGGGRVITAAGLAVSGIELVTVGAGGAGNTSYGMGLNGSPSSLTNDGATIYAPGGGGGGVGYGPAGGALIRTGKNGGSAGGGGATGAGGTAIAGDPAGSGNNGGTGVLQTAGGGGGGAGAVGAAAVGAQGGAGGIGVVSSINGTAVYYGGGGGGSNNDANPGGAGGLGGGGAGSTGSANPGVAGTNGLGGGAGASGYLTVNGVAGGIGVVIVRYSTPTTTTPTPTPTGTTSAYTSNELYSVLNSCNGITWALMIPSERNFNGTTIYRNGTFLYNATNATAIENWYNLGEGLGYEISTCPFYLNGTSNTTWTNSSSHTAICTCWYCGIGVVSADPTIPNLPAVRGQWWLQVWIMENAWWLIVLIVLVLVLKRK